MEIEGILRASAMMWRQLSAMMQGDRRHASALRDMAQRLDALANDLDPHAAPKRVRRRARPH